MIDLLRSRQTEIRLLLVNTRQSLQEIGWPDSKRTNEKRSALAHVIPLRPSAPIPMVKYTYECTNTLLIDTSVHVEARSEWPELKFIVTSNVRFGNAKTIAYSVINTPNEELSDRNDKDSWAKIYLNWGQQIRRRQDLQHEMPVLATWLLHDFWWKSK